MFFFIGVEFGVSHSMTQISLEAWLGAPWWKRLIRAILITSVAVGIKLAFFAIESDDWITQQILPDLLIGFLCFGPLVRLADKVGLSAAEETLKSTEIRDPSEKIPVI